MSGDSGAYSRATIVDGALGVRESVRRELSSEGTRGPQMGSLGWEAGTRCGMEAASPGRAEHS